jgi:hypothetical protein
VAATIALDVDFQFAVGRLDTGFLSFERIEAGKFVTKGRKVNTEKIRCIAGPESIDYRLNTPVYVVRVSTSTELSCKRRPPDGASIRSILRNWPARPKRIECAGLSVRIRPLLA